MPSQSRPAEPDFQDLLRGCFASPQDRFKFQELCHALRPYLEATLAHFTRDWSAIGKACDATFEYLGAQLHGSRFDPSVDYETYLIAVALYRLAAGQVYAWSSSPAHLVLGGYVGSLTPEQVNVLLFTVIWRLDGGCPEKLVFWILSHIKRPFFQSFGEPLDEPNLIRCRDRVREQMAQLLA